MGTSFWQLIGEYKVVIPIIQRDYAQGRNLGKVPLVRKRFLNALHNALTDSADKPLELDFIYGYFEGENGIKKFIPLDGQQRLTTLFLLHWFIAVKETNLKENSNRLEKFTYQTRHSSRVFCQKLISFSADYRIRPISLNIINQPWFFTAWKDDPTISSMLTMLDDIQERFSNTENIWPLLISQDPKVLFHLLPMEKLGLPDELYIKMNSRGKELTEFEHFKSRFSDFISSEKVNEFNIKVDQVWSDLFWNLYKDEETSKDISKLVDNGFLRFIKFITDILIFKNNIITEDGADDFRIYQVVYSDENNLAYLYSCLNKLSACCLEDRSFFNSVFYIDQNEFEDYKVRLFFQSPEIDLFKKCADNYDPSNRINPFSIGEQIMLYACLEHLIHESEDFNKRIRIVRNLIANSEDTVREKNMQSLLITVSKIILENTIDNETKFNTRQVLEENNKQNLITSGVVNRTTINFLEDHHLLQGCIALFDLDDSLKRYADTFYRIFTEKCDYESISRALFSFGNYAQKYSWRWRFGNSNNSVWRELFTPSQRRAYFDKTKEVLNQLLTATIQNPALTLDNINTGHLEEYEIDPFKPKDWKFYYIKYKGFRHNEDGYYYWYPSGNQYECLMLRRSTLGGFHWWPSLYTLFLEFPKMLSLENYGAPLFLSKSQQIVKISHRNIGFKFEVGDPDSEPLMEKIRALNVLDDEDILKVNQNEEGIDIEDRIEKASRLLSMIDSW